MDDKKFSNAWIADALRPDRGWRMRTINWLTRRLLGREYFAVVGRR